MSKAFDRIWQEALWTTMRIYNINADIIRVIENLYDKTQNAVRLIAVQETVSKPVGVRQGCLL